MRELIRFRNSLRVFSAKPAFSFLIVGMVAGNRGERCRL